MTTIATLRREFVFNATVLADPAPDLTPEEALKMYVPNYPFIASARLGEPTIEGDTLRYPVLKPEVQTKGARSARAVAETMKAIQAWEDKQPAMSVTASSWDGVRKLAESVLAREPAPLRDSLMIPLA